MRPVTPETLLQELKNDIGQGAPIELHFWQLMLLAAQDENDAVIEEAVKLIKKHRKGRLEIVKIQIEVLRKPRIRKLLLDLI